MGDAATDGAPCAPPQAVALDKAMQDIPADMVEGLDDTRTASSEDLASNPTLTREGTAKSSETMAAQKGTPPPRCGSGTPAETPPPPLQPFADMSTGSGASWALQSGSSISVLSPQQPSSACGPPRVVGLGDVRHVARIGGGFLPRSGTDDTVNTIMETPRTVASATDGDTGLTVPVSPTPVAAEKKKKRGKMRLNLSAVASKKDEKKDVVVQKLSSSNADSASANCAARVENSYVDAQIDEQCVKFASEAGGVIAIGHDQRSEASDATKRKLPNAVDPLVRPSRNVPAPREEKTQNDRRSSRDQKKKRDEKVSYKDIRRSNQIIGEGGFGCVERVTHKETKKVYALKELKGSMGKKSSPAMKQAEREVLALVKMEKDANPHVVQTLNAYAGGGTMLLLIEYMQYGSLKEYPHQRHPMSMDDIFIVAHSVMGALAYLRRYHIVHRDVKPANILLDYRGAVKLADFGIARSTDPTLSQVVNSHIGTEMWMAPERLTTMKYGYPSDVYAAALVLAYLCRGGKRLQHSWDKIIDSLRLPEDSCPSNFLRTVIEKATREDPEQRPEAKCIMDSVLKYLERKKGREYCDRLLQQKLGVRVDHLRPCHPDDKVWVPSPDDTPLDDGGGGGTSGPPHHPPLGDGVVGGVQAHHTTTGTAADAPRSSQCSFRRSIADNSSPISDAVSVTPAAATTPSSVSPPPSCPAAAGDVVAPPALTSPEGGVDVDIDCDILREALEDIREGTGRLSSGGRHYLAGSSTQPVPHDPPPLPAKEHRRTASHSSDDGSAGDGDCGGSEGSLVGQERPPPRSSRLPPHTIIALALSSIFISAGVANRQLTPLQFSHFVLPALVGVVAFCALVARTVITRMHPGAEGYTLFPARSDASAGTTSPTAQA